MDLVFRWKAFSYKGVKALDKRINTPELIDLGPAYYTSEEYHDCLIQLDRIGRFLMGNRATFWAFQQLKKEPSSILDVGCGGGQLAIQLAKRYPQASVTGIDISHEAIAFAKEQLKKTSLTNVDFCIPPNVQLEELPKSYDVVTATLVLHHLSDQEIIDFLKKSISIAKDAVIINDLHRHSLAKWSFRAIAPICFPNRLILHDGILSIKRSFKRQDWIYYLEAAGIPSQAWSLTWHCLFRWILIIYPNRITS